MDPGPYEPFPIWTRAHGFRLENTKIHLFSIGKQLNTSILDRKTFNTIGDELRARGVTALTKNELIEMYALIFNSTEDDLKAIAVDTGTPYALRIIISELNKPKVKAQALADYRNYCFGKAKEQIDLDVTTAGQAVTVDYSSLSTEALTEILALKAKKGGL